MVIGEFSLQKMGKTMATTKTRAKKKATAKKPVGKSAKKAAPKKKVAAKKSPAKQASRAAAPAYLDQPEGMFARLASMRDEMDQLFDSLSRSFGFSDFKIPTIEMPSRAGIADVRFEVSESDKAVEVSAEAPGLDTDDFEITLSEGTLTVRGQKRDKREQKGKDFFVSERRYGSFSRSFRLPDSVDEDKISANFDKGVLSIHLPKRAKPKRKPKAIQLAKE